MVEDVAVVSGRLVVEVYQPHGISRENKWRRHKRTSDNDRDKRIPNNCKSRVPWFLRRRPRGWSVWCTLDRNHAPNR